MSIHGFDLKELCEKSLIWSTIIYQSQQGVELTQYKLIKHFYTHLHTSNLRPERAKLTIRVQQTSNEFKSFHWNGTSVEIFLQLMENVFRIFTNSEFVNWFFYSMDPILLVLLKVFCMGQLRVVVFLFCVYSLFLSVKIIII